MDPMDILLTNPAGLIGPQREQLDVLTNSRGLKPRQKLEYGQLVVPYEKKLSGIVSDSLRLGMGMGYDFT
jgi:hypothetical protein